MGRSDGTKVKGMPALDLLIPHIMNRRTDSVNFAKIEIDITNLKTYLDELRDNGQKVGIMDAVIAAFAFILNKCPEINRFVVNKRIYQRNHICVAFAMLKRTDGVPAETVVKVYIEPEDDLVTISKKIRSTIKENEKPTTKNTMDVFINKLASMPFLPGLGVGLIKIMDKYGFLPRKIIDLSPFHSSMFISNLASLRMDHIYHHLYEFGTTSLFITMGKPIKENDKKTITLGISMDERICIGATWAKAFYEFKQYLENPGKFMN